MNSLIVAAVATALCVLFGAMAGYALARLRFPGRDALFLLFLASLMIPPEVGVVPLLLAMIKVGWASTYQALILPSIGNVFAVYIFRQFFLTFPRELEEAAIDRRRRPLPASSSSIALPLARSPTIAATVIVFTLNWNNFLWPLLVTFDEDMKTLPVGIAAFAPVVGTHTQIEGYAVGDGGGDAPLHSVSVLLFLAPAALLHPGHHARAASRRERTTMREPTQGIDADLHRRRIGSSRPRRARRFATDRPVAPRSRSARSRAATPRDIDRAVRAADRALRGRMARDDAGRARPPAPAARRRDRSATRRSWRCSRRSTSASR